MKPCHPKVVAVFAAISLLSLLAVTSIHMHKADAGSVSESCSICAVAAHVNADTPLQSVETTAVRQPTFVLATTINEVFVLIQSRRFDSRAPPLA